MQFAWHIQMTEEKMKITEEGNVEGTVKTRFPGYFSL